MTQDMSERLRAMVIRDGDAALAEEAGVSRYSVVRAALGVAVQRRVRQALIDVLARQSG